MFKAFQQHIQSHFPKLSQQKLLLAISGGVDSMVLLDFMQKSTLNIAVAHCNFNLRGAESDADATFVKETTESYGIEFFLKSFQTTTYATENGLNTQLAARELRYAWFEKLAEQHQFDHIVVAHHANDKLETFLINLSRGTGIEGLSGIPEVNGKIIRPLLPFSREEILEYAKINNIAWREDSSNASDKYIRNKIRHHITPLLAELHPNFLANFLQTQTYLSDTVALVKNHIKVLQLTLFEKDGDLIKISVEKLKALEPRSAYLFELFKEFGFTAWNDVENLLDAMSGKTVASKTHEFIKDRDFLVLRTIPVATQQSYIFDEIPSIIHKPLLLKVTKVTEIEEKCENTIYVDAEKLNLPLVVRRWHTGDYFHPFGMSGKKKLSKFYKDEKYSLPQKESQWILTSKEDIVWVIGKRADQRFAVSSKTTSILKIELQP